MKLFLLTIASSLLATVEAHFNGDNNIAVYWGQAEAGDKVQNDLSYYCQSESVDIVILAFISQFGKQYVDSDQNPDGFVLNLSDKCNEDSDGYTVCPTLESDIKTCQDLGKKVLLSLGGESSSTQKYGFQDDDEAKEFASTLWNSFGEGASQHRPFGTAVIDGFDFDVETTDQTGYLALALQLKKTTQDEGSKSYIFTAAPQCTLPDQYTSNLLDNFEMDHIYVQFYNNEGCELESPGFNYDQWVENTLKNGHSDTKIYIGLPSAKNAAGSGFINNVNDLYDKFIELNNSDPKMIKDNFGGFMFWDASRGFSSTDRDSYDKSYIYRVWSTFNDTQDDENSSGATLSQSNGDTSSNPKNENMADAERAPMAMLMFVMLTMMIVSA
ncbi:CYFA0S29e01068g1_1 [Cyberlindnera fabianii]|uniref:chitinase n=1 Tax=Cyberlindnera fabianii TaxID=36022 RepID=A0A061BGZ7_CYBFA|nr:CYFA0S29e01068g1_1 [Cyberlindnera fabianii]